MSQEDTKPTIQQALSAVMGDVQSISKDSRNTSQNFNFRGIDAVMNAVGPALRDHGVVVVPVAVVGEHENYTTKTGTAMKNVILTVTYRFYGPAGDYIEATARGEAADSGDKATPKAHSVAFRTLLLQALCIPTDEPDPDAASHERVVERREEGTRPSKVPRTGAEVKARLAEVLGEAEAEVWLAQAQEYAQGKTLAPTGLQRLAGVVVDLEENPDFDPRLFPPIEDLRERVQQVFAARFDGAVFQGPPWAMTGDEEKAGALSKAEFLAGT